MMKIDWDVPITLADGLVLRADVLRPLDAGKYPVIISYGPYGKWLHFEDLYTDQWRRMAEQPPDVVAGSTNKYQNWEVVDPEKWVPDGYACVRVDSRGWGRSPGRVDLWSAQEARDFSECIEWAGRQRGVRAGGLGRLRAVAGPRRSVVGAGGARLLRVHRVGGPPAVEQREGRRQRHLVLRDEPVAGGGAAATAPRRDLHLGRRRRLLPRSLASRGDPLHVRPRLVPVAGGARPARPRHPRLSLADERRLGVRAADAQRGRAGGEPQRLLRGLLEEPAGQRRLLALADARLVEGEGAAV